MENFFEKTRNLSFFPSKEKLKWNMPVDGEQYTFAFPQGDKREKGDAMVIYQTLKAIAWLELQQALLDEGLQPDDIIAHLNEFYPNGRGLNEKTNENMREGVGSEAFEYLLEEIKNRNAKAVRVFSGKESMQSFLAKKGFKSVKNLKYNYFKKLT